VDFWFFLDKTDRTGADHINLEIFKMNLSTRLASLGLSVFPEELRDRAKHLIRVAHGSPDHRAEILSTLKKLSSGDRLWKEVHQFLYPDWHLQGGRSHGRRDDLKHNDPKKNWVVGYYQGRLFEGTPTEEETRIFEDLFRNYQRETEEKLEKSVARLYQKLKSIAGPRGYLHKDQLQRNSFLTPEIKVLLHRGKLEHRWRGPDPGYYLH